MKFPLLVALTLAVLTGAARAEDDNYIRQATKAEAETFSARVFSGPPEQKRFACFVRRYDADHLAQHPKQKVATMKLLMSTEYDKEDKELHYSFRLGFKYRQRSANFDSAGSCHHAVFEDTGNEVRFGCGVECDGGGIGVALSQDDKSAIVRLERVRAWQSGKQDDEGDESLVAGSDDKMFRLDRAPNSDCASLVTDRKELAALRHK
ncbi:hypothetical protein [Bradyrhizobium liaoningense]|uniref:hypothetical protein n=1 Tax=Bradyrhizobium liaoningense TaxID=43992 RepID=UPI001BABFB51|nr:hypothetical protein [Bradyrhizobium liaoningense]MBR0714827.1 hypothetical protein [Bradyrhizobium liaoningense]